MQRSAVRTLRLLAMMLAAAALLIPAAAAARGHAKGQHHRHHARDHDGDRGAGALYTTTNDPAGNAVVVYARHADGTIVQTGTVPTGGTGIASQPPFGFPIVDSSGSTNLTPDGRLLFVVNAGDNTVSSLKVTGTGLQKVDTVPTGPSGSSHTLPISLTSHGNVLYVVNEESSNIYGWWFSPNGHLTPIPGSFQSLSTLFPTTVAAQIGFSPDGGQLVVTERGLPAPNGVIDTFFVNGSGAAGAAVKHVAPTPNPFGFSFAGPKNLLVSDAGFVATPSGSAANPGDSPPNPADPSQFFGSAASFSLHSSGELTFKGDFPSGGRAACWLVVTKDNRYAFVTNTLSSPAGSPAGILTGTGAVSTYAISPHGRLTLVPQRADTGPGFPGDEAVTSDGKYLYVLVPFVVGGPSHIAVFRVGSGGVLTNIGNTNNDLPNGVSGIGVH
jgi:6-phosphogluconolactonase